MSKYDIAIIGSGPGGYVAGLYAAGSGKKVVVIEKDRLGGVCLNWGCIPTKTLIASVKTLKAVKRSKEFGIDVSSFNVNYADIRKRKDDVINTLKKGIESLLKAKKAELVKGFAKFLDKNTLDVEGTKIEADNIIIATGTVPLELPNFKFDGKRVLRSAELLDADDLPKKLLIVGGGVNGCEYAYIFASFGVDVTVVEMMDRLLPTMDRELGKNMEMILKKHKVKIQTKTKLEKIPAEYDKAVICVGRKTNVDGIGLDKAGVKTENRKIVVNTKMQTNVPNIYAIGDVTGGYLLAHVASHEGITACNNILGRPSEIDYGSVPLCIYTEPEISSVGLTQDEAAKEGREVKISKFPFRGLGKSHAIGEKDGFVKIVGDKDSGKVLGIQIVGAQAADLIAEATPIVKKGITVKELCELIHAHPTLSEAVMEAAFSFDGRPIHAL